MRHYSNELLPVTLVGSPEPHSYPKSCLANPALDVEQFDPSLTCNINLSHCRVTLQFANLILIFIDMITYRLFGQAMAAIKKILSTRESIDKINLSFVAR